MIRVQRLPQELEKCRQVGLRYCFCFAGHSQTGGVLGLSDSPNKGIEPKPALPTNPMKIIVSDPNTPLRVIRVRLDVTREDPSSYQPSTMSTPPSSLHLKPASAAITCLLANRHARPSSRAKVGSFQACFILLWPILLRPTECQTREKAEPRLSFPLPGSSPNQADHVLPLTGYPILTCQSRYVRPISN